MRAAWLAATVLTFVYVTGLCLGSVVAPGVGLDKSWGLGLTEAHVLGLVFGRDIVFTYGPLGYLFAGVATPQTFTSQVLARTCFAVCVGATIVALAMRPMPAYRRCALVAAIAIALAMANGDQRLLVTLLVVAAVILLGNESRTLPRRALFAGLVAGFLSLTVFSTAIECLAAGGAVLGIRLLTRLAKGLPYFCDLFAAAAFCGAALASSALPFAIIDAGRPLALLGFAGFIGAVGASVLYFERSTPSRAPSFGTWTFLGTALALAVLLGISADYLRFVAGSLQVSFGYSAGMSELGKSSDVAIALLEMSLVALIGIRNFTNFRGGGIVALVLISWLTFKEGFVRQDAHTFQFFVSECLVFAVLVGQAATVRGTALAAFAFAVSFFVYVSQAEITYPGAPILPNLDPRSVAQTVGSFASSWSQARAPETLRDALAQDAFPIAIRKKIATLPIDIQTSETNVVFANDFRWAPEPMFQSYAAYTRALDRSNADSLQAKNRRVLLNYVTIDGRYVMEESPAARRTLLCNYSLDRAFGDQMQATQDGTRYIVLDRGRERCTSRGTTRSFRVRFGQLVKLPSAARARLAFVSLDIRYSLLGRIVKTLFKAPPISLTLRTANGTSAQYRILSEVSKTGFLINPVPASAAEYVQMTEGLLAGREASMSVAVDWPWMYDRNIGVAFEVVSLAS